MGELKKHTSNLSTTSITQKQQELLNLAKSIVTKTINLGSFELQLSIDKTIDKPIMKSLFKNENSQIGFTLVGILVNRFIDGFGFSTKLSETQLEILTYDTIEKFSYESLEDIVLFFKMARSGSFGTTKRGVDSNLIFGEWFPMYMELKAQAREQLHVIEKKTAAASLISIKEVKKSYEKMQVGNSFRDRVLNYIEKITEGINRQQLEDLITEWSEDEQKKQYLRELKLKRLTIK